MMKKLKRVGFIYFGYTGNFGTNTDSYVFLDFNNMQITNEQIKWVENNTSKLQNKQIIDFKKLVNFKIKK
jgi:hypothetical protein